MIELTKQKVICGSCNEDLSQFTFSRNKKKIGATIGAIILGVGSFQVSEHLYPAIDRYPMADEYRILDACINSHQVLLTEHEYSKKKKICICALDKSTKQYNYESLISNPKSFSPIFIQNMRSCE